MMSHAAQARRLKEHIASLETMTRFVLATLALASGVYTYLGVRSLLDGSATVVFFAAVIYSASVSVAIYGFWTYLIRFLPEMRDGGSRLALFVIMAIGSLMIVAMSSWLNAAALAGSAAVEQHLADHARGLHRRPRPGARQRARRAVAAARHPARRRALRAARRRRAQFRRAHRHLGLGQRRPAPDADVGADEGAGSHDPGSRETIQTAFEQGQKHLANDARAGLGAGRDRRSAPTSSRPKSVALSGVIASLQQTSIAPSVSRAAADLSVGFIAPVADGSSHRSRRPAGPGDGDDPRVRRGAVQGARRTPPTKSSRSRRWPSAATCR